MIPVREVAPRAVTSLLREQPLTSAKVRFAWCASVGTAMARATAVDLAADGTLHVAADGEHWRKETARSVVVIRRRLRELLGRGVVKRIALKG